MKSNELVEEVRKVAKNVYEELGGGFKETVYQNAMAVELEMEKGTPTVRERSIDLYYKGYPVGRGQVDLLVGDEEKVIVELKAKRNLTPLDKNQLGMYINSAKRDLDMQDVKTGLLLNFPYAEEEVEELDKEQQITQIKTEKKS